MVTMPVNFFKVTTIRLVTGFWGVQVYQGETPKIRDKLRLAIWWEI